MDARQNLCFKREPVLLDLGRIVNHVRAAEVVPFKVVVNSVLVLIDEGGRLLWIGVYPIDQPVVVSVAAVRIRPGGDFLAVGLSVEVGIGKVGIRPKVEQLHLRRNAVTVSVGID